MVPEMKQKGQLDLTLTPKKWLFNGIAEKINKNKQEKPLDTMTYISRFLHKLFAV